MRLVFGGGVELSLARLFPADGRGESSEGMGT